MAVFFLNFVYSASLYTCTLDRKTRPCLTGHPIGDPKYEDAVSRVSEIVHGLEKNMGLVPIFINANSGKFRQRDITGFI